MIDARTLLFANAVVFGVLAAAMVLVWLGNRPVAGLGLLARVHGTMMVGTALIGAPPGVIAPSVSAFVGNALVILSLLWLVEGFEQLYGHPRRLWPWVTFPAWAVCFLALQFVEPNLRARILVTNVISSMLLFWTAWLVRPGLQSPGERKPSLLILGSLGLLSLVIVARSVALFARESVMPVDNDALTIALLTVSLVAGTGWSLGVVILVYARLNADRSQYAEELQQLVQVAAHEIRTPLTAVHGTLKMLASGIFPVPKQEPLISGAMRNSERMIRLLDELLDLERVESGQGAFQLERMDLGRLLVQANELNEPLARQLGVRLEIGTLPDVEVYSDPSRILQVLSNLLSNALKYSPPGEAVRVRVEHRTNVVRVEVHDRGPGIPAEMEHRIFQRFHRGPDPLASGVPKGAGLGLAISKALVTRMGGKIGYEANKGAGTIFYFELPRPLDHDPRATSRGRRGY